MRLAPSPSSKISAFAVLGLAASFLISAALARQPQKTEAVGDYFPLQVGYSWTYRNSEEGGYTLKVLRQDPHEGGPARYDVELVSGVTIHKTYSKTPGWILYHGESYPEHEG